jgi:hypothetical protein
MRKKIKGGGGDNKLNNVMALIEAEERKEEQERAHNLASMRARYDDGVDKKWGVHSNNMQNNAAQNNVEERERVKLKNLTPLPPIQNADNNVDRIEETVYGGKKTSKKEVLGKMRCIYKIPGDRKEYVKYKGKLITVKDYKMLNKKPGKVTNKKPKTVAKDKKAKRPKKKST